MNLKITSEITLSSGLTCTDAVAWLMTYPTMNAQGGLDVPCDINTYVSLELRDEGADQVYPIVNGYNKITNCTITLTPEQAAAEGLPLTIYQQVATYLNTTYGWTVTVEQ